MARLVVSDPRKNWAKDENREEGEGNLRGWDKGVGWEGGVEEGGIGGKEGGGRGRERWRGGGHRRRIGGKKMKREGE